MSYYNALRISVDDEIAKVHIDFPSDPSDATPFEETLDCRRTSIVHTQGTIDLGNVAGRQVCMICNANADDEWSNDIAAEVSGYDVLNGDVLVVGCGSGYVYEPLDDEELDALVEYLIEEYDACDATEEDEEPDEDDDDDSGSNIFPERGYGSGSGNIFSEGGSGNIRSEGGSGSGNIWSED